MASQRIAVIVAKLGAPSYRLRLLALQPFARSAGLEMVTAVLPRRPEWLRLFRLAQVVRSADLIVFSKVKLLLGETFLMRRWCPLWVYDVDDAVMYGKPRRHGDPPSRAFWRRRRFARMVRNCVLTVVGSQQLAEMIKPLGGHTVVYPTPVDVSKYPMAEPGREGELILVWIGLGKNLRYLEDLGGVLAAMARQFPFKLRVISDRIPNLPGVPLELVPWSEVSEGEELARGHVGLAPLPDDLWTRGKGGYRCIQYAAAGLPCVASPVGANREVVVPGISGFWASTPEEWWSQLALLFSRPELRRAMGEQARQRALALYDLPKLAPRYIGWLKALLGEDSLSVLGRLDDQQPRTAV